jgi:hypothetical protein
VVVATVLNSPRAVALSVLVVRAFVRLRSLIASHHTPARRLDELERRYDGQFEVVFQAHPRDSQPALRRSAAHRVFRGGMKQRGTCLASTPEQKFDDVF